MKTKKRKRRSLYSATKLITPSGSEQYLSCIKDSQRKNREVKNPDAAFWADWKPYRKLGVYANERAASYTHNGITRYM